MKKNQLNLKATGLVAFSFLVLALAGGCKNPVLPLPPIPTPVPTMTPTAVPTCQTTGFTTLSGSGALGQSIGAILGTPTPTPTPSWSWTGSVPPHPAGVFLIQTASDWTAFVASSYVPTASFPIPFNPATQALVVMATEGFCPNYFDVSSVCNTGGQLTVQVDEHASCCPVEIVIHGILATTAFSAVVVDTGGVPVTVRHTFYPWVGPLCE